jgi:NAD(P)-dependent dehydrogenase (short-subunit alcohol dehydrogenase family)
MARILITGSTDGLGLFNAQTLIGQGHEVILHARSHERAASLGSLARQAHGVVVGDLSSAAETAALADQVRDSGPVDTVIHNAGVYLSHALIATAEGHSRTLAVNVLAPYLLTASLPRPSRIIVVSSGMHIGAKPELDDIDWTARRWDATAAYCESKLHVAALAAAIAQRWPDVLANSVDPGWVPTKMGGAGASDDLELGHLTQSWLAVSQDPAALVSGGYWHHQQQQRPAPEVNDPAYHDRLLARLAELTGTEVSW